MFHPTLKERLSALEAERSRILALQSEPVPLPVSIHPNLAEGYRRKVADLEQLIADPELGQEAMELIRSMITGIAVMPRSSGDGVDLDLSGDLARILGICSAGAAKQDARAVAGAGRDGDFRYEVSVVAGARFELTTFRL